MLWACLYAGGAQQHCNFSKHWQSWRRTRCFASGCCLPRGMPNVANLVPLVIYPSNFDELKQAYILPLLLSRAGLCHTGSLPAKDVFQPHQLYTTCMHTQMHKNQIIGWRSNSVHLVVFITDANYHIAGDGKVRSYNCSGGECVIKAMLTTYISTKLE